MENKKWFILYSDQKSLVDKLPDEKAWKLFKHIFAYVNDENPKVDDLVIEIAFEPIKQQLKRDLEKRNSEKEKRSIAGVKGMQTRWGKNKGNITKDKSVINDIIKDKSVIKSITKITDNVNVNVNVNDNVKDKDIYKIYNNKSYLTNKQVEKLKSEYKSKIIDDYIEDVENYIVNNPKWKYVKDVNLTIRNWLRKNWIKKKEKVESNSTETETDNFFTKNF